MKYWIGLGSPGLHLPHQITLRTNKILPLSSPRDLENTILGEQAMCLCTLLLNTWMFILLEPSPFSLMLLK